MSEKQIEFRHQVSAVLRSGLANWDCLERHPVGEAQRANIAAAARSAPPISRRISLPVDLDVFLAAAMGNRDHDADTDQNRDSD